MAALNDAPLDVVIPGDKSLSHRALMFAALARGTSSVRGILDSDDIRSTAECMRRLGAGVPPLSADMSINAAGVSALRNPAEDLDCGNSGTSARLLSGLVSGAGITARFTGDGSLSKRPMKRVAEPLTRMGARFEFERGEGLPMMVIGGPLMSIDFISPTPSAQVKSALLLAGVTSGAAVTVREPARSRDHTERMLAALGASVSVSGTAVSLRGDTRALSVLDFDVPGDPSSAAFFAAWAVLSGRTIRTNPVSVNETRTGFFSALARAGARISVESQSVRCGEPVGSLVIGGRLDRAFALAEAQIPSMIDELPLVACLAAYAPGETRVTGAAELRVKESDRIAAVVANLRAVGVDAEELRDGFVVRGGRRPLKGSVVTHADHRIAMAFGILGALDGNDITIDDPDCAGVSFPGFWNELARLRGGA
ncbi:MAG TPA: 3-phosphoshikimate 1-carboxyvinyltransferase [Gemmatimonadaceae bacterium]|nr:3-phosphoshikimate 1-carboxyvinyltransferase [Gemmatimonadaceae bacterium]